jgi:hypothetical protein
MVSFRKALAALVTASTFAWEVQAAATQWDSLNVVKKFADALLDPAAHVNTSAEGIFADEVVGEVDGESLIISDFHYRLRETCADVVLVLSRWVLGQR